MLNKNARPVLGVESVENGFVVNLYEERKVQGLVGEVDRVETTTYVFKTMLEALTFISHRFGIKDFDDEKKMEGIQ